MNSAVKAIIQRNERVTTDKAWETSVTRKLIIAAFTYIIVSIFLIIINVSNPFVNALVPTFGYLLSTLSLTPIKELWIKRIYKK